MQYWITWLKTERSQRRLHTGSWPGSTQDFLLITQYLKYCGDSHILTPVLLEENGKNPAITVVAKVE
jgi:hypothetical protein